MRRVTFVLLVGLIQHGAIQVDGSNVLAWLQKHTGLDGTQVGHLVEREKKSLSFSGGRHRKETLKILTEQQPAPKIARGNLQREDAEVRRELAKLDADDSDTRLMQKSSRPQTVLADDQPTLFRTAAASPAKLDGHTQPSPRTQLLPYDRTQPLPRAQPQRLRSAQPQPLPARMLSSGLAGSRTHACEGAIERMGRQLSARHCSAQEQQAAFNEFQLVVAAGFKIDGLTKLCATPCIDHLVRVSRNTIMQHCDFARRHSFLSKLLLSCPPVSNLPRLHASSADPPLDQTLMKPLHHATRMSLSELNGTITSSSSSSSSLSATTSSRPHDADSVLHVAPTGCSVPVHIVPGTVDVDVTIDSAAKSGKPCPASLPLFAANTSSITPVHPAKLWISRSRATNETWRLSLSWVEKAATIPPTRRPMPQPSADMAAKLGRLRKILHSDGQPADASTATVLVHGSVSAFDSARFARLMAKALRLLPSQIEVLGLHAASVLVTFRVLHDGTVELDTTLRKLLVERNAALVELGVEEVLLVHRGDIAQSESQQQQASLMVFVFFAVAFAVLALAACLRMTSDTSRTKRED